METDIAKVDAQHKELVNRINAVTTMGAAAFSKEETRKTLDMLGDYIVKHFSDEEQLQKSSGYPKYEWHKGQHVIYVTEFHKLKDDFEKNGVTPTFTLALNNSIIGWIVKHIKNVDVEFGKFYNSRA